MPSPLERFRALPLAVRRPLALIPGLLFVWLVFFAGPALMMDWNEARGWPRWQHPLLRVAGGLLVVAGVGVTLYCSQLFERLGRGTPIPVDPPKELVVAGPYRWSRNPDRTPQSNAGSRRSSSQRSRAVRSRSSESATARARGFTAMTALSRSS